MSQIKPYPIPEKVKCFQDDGEMEFIMPESQLQDYISFRCQICGVIYQIPVDQVSKSVRISLEFKNEPDLFVKGGEE